MLCSPRRRASEVRALLWRHRVSTTSILVATIIVAAPLQVSAQSTAPSALYPIPWGSLS
jgi:hypothetical protein